MPFQKKKQTKLLFVCLQIRFLYCLLSNTFLCEGQHMMHVYALQQAMKPLGFKLNSCQCQSGVQKSLQCHSFIFFWWKNAAQYWLNSSYCSKHTVASIVSMLTVASCFVTTKSEPKAPPLSPHSTLIGPVILRLAKNDQIGAF